MAFSMPSNTFEILMKLTGIVMGKMQEAGEAFGGGVGSGEKKKAFVLSAIKESVEFQDMVSADLMTPEQEAKLVEAADFGVEFIFASVELAKLFQEPKTA